MVVRRRLPALPCIIALLAVGCGGGGQPRATEAVPVPASTVTVSETVTAGPLPASPSPPARCTPELASLAFVFVTAPLPGSRVSSPIRVEGCANTFEANVEWRLLGAGGTVLGQGHTTATCGTGCVGDFRFEAPFSVQERQIGTLEVFETSPADGSVQLLNSIPLVLEP